MAQKKSAANTKDKSVRHQAVSIRTLNNQQESHLRLAGIIHESVVDGPGIRSVVFTQGCPHGCNGCHSMDTWDFKGGHDKTVQNIAEEIISRPHIDGITYSGGEPFYQPKPLVALTRLLIEHDSCFNFWIYSGYTIEALTAASRTNEDVNELLYLCDILVDGPYIDLKKDLKLRFRGSSNQRIIDLKTKKVLE